MLGLIVIKKITPLIKLTPYINFITEVLRYSIKERLFDDQILFN